MSKNASRSGSGFGTITAIEEDRHQYAEAEAPATQCSFLLPKVLHTGTLYDDAWRSIQDLPTRIATRIAGPCSAVATATRAIRLHAAKVPGRAWGCRRLKHTIPPALAAGTPGCARQRMAQTGQAEQTVLPALNRRQGDPEATPCGVEEHRCISGRDSKGVSKQNLPFATCELTA